MTTAHQRDRWPRDRPKPAPIDPTVLTRTERLEWEHFAAYGWSDEKIAHRLGLDLESLQARVRRLARRMAS